MNGGDDILRLITDGLERTLDALAAGERDAAAQAFAAVRPALAGRALEDVFDGLLAADGEVRRIAPRFYAGPGFADTAVAAAAHGFVADALPGPAPLVLLQQAVGGARQLSELDGISVVQLSPEEAGDRETMVHELTHAHVRSGHRMLDEGLAEWMGALAVHGPERARSELARRAEGGPDAAVLAARRWTDQPCFEGLDAPRGAPHAVAALRIADLLDARGTDGLMQLLAEVKQDRTEDVRALIGEAASPAGAAEALSPEDSAAIRRQFRTGETAGADDRLPALRRMHMERPDDQAAEEAYLVTLLLAANHPDAEALRAEFDRALETYVARRDDTAMAYALCVSREGLNIRYAPDFIAMNESFERGRAIIEAALDDWERDVDVLATAAKFEFHTPLEYGGSPTRARTYLQRAAAVTHDPALLAHFRAALDNGVERAAA